MMRPLSTLWAIALMYGYAYAQLELPVHLELNGTSEAERQVSGLADPTNLDAAVSAEAARSQVLTSATTTGTSTLIGTLQPNPGPVVAGMLVTLIPQETNVTGAQLSLNGTGPFPIVKWGNVPVDSADLTVGVPNRLVFDGTHFQLIHWNARPCAAGTMAGSALYCIDEAPLATGTFYDAATTCSTRGGRLCSFNEWSSACRRNPSFLPSVAGYEWIEDAANNPNDAKLVGQGYNGPDIMEGVACEYGWTTAPLGVHRYRCCYNR